MLLLRCFNGSTLLCCGFAVSHCFPSPQNTPHPNQPALLRCFAPSKHWGKAVSPSAAEESDRPT